MYIRASSRHAISRSIFSTTFLVAFTLALANTLVPCPAEKGVNNDSVKATTETRQILEKEQELKRKHAEQSKGKD